MNLDVALVDYHLYIMEKADIVKSQKEGGYKRYYVSPSKSGLDSEQRRILGVLRQKIPLQITLYILKEKQATHTKISNDLDIKPSRLSFHLKKMRKLGIVKKLQPGEGKGYVVEDEALVIRLLLRYKPPQDMLDEFTDLWDDLAYYA
ncbi:MAG: ArsR family transcriptional regulator, partial [Candidatus Thorarchaeota archaeon]